MTKICKYEKCDKEVTQREGEYPSIYKKRQFCCKAHASAQNILNGRRDYRATEVPDNFCKLPGCGKLIERTKNRHGYYESPSRYAKKETCCPEHKKAWMRIKILRLKTSPVSIAKERKKISNIDRWLCGGVAA